jgi:hypothetical protein
LPALQRVQRTGTQGFLRLSRTSAVPPLLCRVALAHSAFALWREIMLSVKDASSPA